MTTPSPSSIWLLPDAGRIAPMLDSESLPSADLHETPRDVRRVFVGLGPDPEQLPWAVGGLDIYGESALLRSVVVVRRHRGQGFALAIVERLEAIARNAEVGEIVLLTTTAADFFRRLGYRQIDRAELPAQIRAAPQVTQLCPGSATVMAKRLASAAVNEPANTRRDPVR